VSVSIGELSDRSPALRLDSPGVTRLRGPGLTLHRQEDLIFWRCRHRRSSISSIVPGNDQESSQVSWGLASRSGNRSYDLTVFVVTLTYLVDLSEVDAALPKHVAWLDQQYADGVFIASGRQVPSVGGLILVAGTDGQDLEPRLALDPFGRLGLAEHAVVEFVPSRVANGLEQVLR
jgi:uncharacterized protein YciI